MVRKDWEEINVPEREKAVAFLTERGWYEYYNKNYWVHNKNVADKSQMDPTNYGMSVEDAYRFETLGMPPFQPFGLPQLSMILHAHANLKELSDA